VQSLPDLVILQKLSNSERNRGLKVQDLQTNLVKRVDRLPKPRNAAMALQPLFEAISNSIHSVQERFGGKVSQKGEIRIEVKVDRSKLGVAASVSDNGVGLNEKNWKAFRTTDTDNKISIGGKGVGRLLWFDCFSNVSILSRYDDGSGKFREKKFDFVLRNEGQIQNESDVSTAKVLNPRFRVNFSGLRANGYRGKFPGRGAYVFQHFVSHFLPTLAGKNCPKIELSVNDEEKVFPGDLKEVVFRSPKAIKLETKKFGSLKFLLLECDKSTSSDLKGFNFVHFVAHDRTVVSQAIDGKLGLKIYGQDNDRVFHGIVTGQYLDKNVNQERTAFHFPESEIDKIISGSIWPHIEKFLAQPLGKHRAHQKEVVGNVTSSYPSVSFGDVDELLTKVPSGEVVPDAIYGHLARERFRRDERQAEKIRTAFKRLKGSALTAENFFSTISEAGQLIEDAGQRSLSDYVVRRKVILEFVRLLIEKVRNSDGDASFQREDVLHTLICPMHVATVGNGLVEASPSHELWLIDERLTFAKYFSSDVEFEKIAEGLNSSERSDLVAYDHVHGLKGGAQAGHVLLVEFKRAGREDYGDDENPQMQIERYVRRLKSGTLKDNHGRKISITDETMFDCFVVADIVGKLDQWTYSWARTSGDRSRYYRSESGFKGTIEVISWDALVDDAELRNQAFFDRAGISGESFFLPEAD